MLSAASCVRLSRPVWLGPSWMSRPSVEVNPDPSPPSLDLTVLDLDSPYVRALQKKNKRRQGWSLSMLFRSPRPRSSPPACLQASASFATVLPKDVADALPSSSDVSWLRRVSLKVQTQMSGPKPPKSWSERVAPRAAQGVAESVGHDPTYKPRVEVVARSGSSPDRLRLAWDVSR